MNMTTIETDRDTWPRPEREGHPAERARIIWERLNAVNDKAIRVHVLEEGENDQAPTLWVWLGMRCSKLSVPIGNFIAHAHHDLTWALRSNAELVAQRNQLRELLSRSLGVVEGLVEALGEGDGLTDEEQGWRDEAQQAMAEMPHQDGKAS